MTNLETVKIRSGAWRGGPEKMMIGEARRGLRRGGIGEWMLNSLSGSLNATVTHGYLVENGEPTKPIKV